MLYFAGIRALGENYYIEVGECFESGFGNWLKRASSLRKKVGKKLFVDFRQRPHTFEINADGSPHLLTPEVMVDPALAAQSEGS